MSTTAGKAAFLLKTKSSTSTMKSDAPPPPKPLKLESVFPPPKATRIDTNSSMKGSRGPTTTTKTATPSAKEEPKTEVKVVEAPPTNVVPPEANETTPQASTEQESSNGRAKYAGIKSAKERFMEEASKFTNPTPTERPVIQPRKISPPREGVAVGVLENKPQERNPNIVCSGDGTVKDFRTIQATKLLSKFRDLESGKALTVDDDENADGGDSMNDNRRTSKDATDISVNTKDLKSHFLKLANESQQSASSQKTSGVGGNSEDGKWASQAKERFMEEAKKATAPKDKKRVSLTGDEDVTQAVESTESAQFTAEARRRILQMQNEAANQEKPKKPPAMINIWEDLCEYSGVFENNPTNRQGVQTTAQSLAPASQPESHVKQEPTKAPEPAATIQTQNAPSKVSSPAVPSNTQPPTQAVQPAQTNAKAVPPSKPSQPQTKNPPIAAYGSVSNKGVSFRRF